MSATDHPNASGVYLTYTHTCDSTIDASVTGLSYDLYIDTGVLAALGTVPIGLLCKGYTGDRLSFNSLDGQRAASALGACLIYGGRGNNGATGAKDANARATYDIKDCVEDARRRHPTALSPTLCMAYGAYSGGGGDACAMLLKLPGFLAATALYFPLVDYASWYTYNVVQSVALLDADIGGSPAAYPDRYTARHFGRWLPFALASVRRLVWSAWDTGDPVLDPATQQAFVDDCAALGVTIPYTKSTDGTIEHGYPQAVPGLIAHEIVYAATMRAATANTMPTTGSLPMVGWIEWDSLSVWCGSSTDPRANDGGDRVGIISFDTTAHVYRVSPLTGPMYVDLRDGGESVRFLCVRTCIVDAVARTVTEIDAAPTGPLLAATAPLLSGAAPLLGPAPAIEEPRDLRTRTRLQ